MLAAWLGHSTAIRLQGALGSPRARDDQNITQRLGVTSPRHFRSPAHEEVPGQVMHAVHPGGTARPTRWWGRLASLPCSAPHSGGPCPADASLGVGSGLRPRPTGYTVSQAPGSGAFFSSNHMSPRSFIQLNPLGTSLSRLWTQHGEHTRYKRGTDACPQGPSIRVCRVCECVCTTTDTKLRNKPMNKISPECGVWGGSTKAGHSGGRLGGHVGHPRKNPREGAI